VEPVEKVVAAAPHACKVNLSPLFNMNETFIDKPQEVVPVPLAGIVGPVIFNVGVELNTRYRILNASGALTFTVRLIIALLVPSAAI
jgi:hypothetical protein